MASVWKQSEFQATGWPGLDRREAPVAESRGFLSVQPRSPRVKLVLAIAVVVSLVFARPEWARADSAASPSSDAPSAQPNPAVKAGRDALSAPPERFPWYDPDHDSLRRIELNPGSNDQADSGGNSTDGSSGHRPGDRGRGYGRGGSGDGGDGSDAPGGSRDNRRNSSSSWNIDPSAATATWLIWLAWGALAVALAVIAYYLIKAFLNREARGAKESASDEMEDPESNPLESLPAKVNRAKGDLLDECRRLYEVGNYNLAIIYLFAYQLIKLDQNQWLRLAKGKTNRDYLRELAVKPELSGILGRTMVPFEDVFFGGHQLDRASFEACWQEVDRFQRLALQAAA